MRDGPNFPAEWRKTDSTFLQHLAYILASQNREDQAADLLEYVLLEDPNNAEAMKALVGVYFLLERHESVLSMGEKALKHHLPDADAASIRMVQARALHAMGRIEEAQSMMARYLTERDTK